MDERLLESFIEHAPAVIAMFDRDMRYLATSARWKTDYDLDSDLIGRSHYDVFPEIPEHWKEIHRRALGGEVLGAEKDPFRRFDGSVQWLRWEARPWYRAEREIGGIVIFSEDITEHVKVHEALKVSEERFRLVANITNDVIFDWDLRSEKVWWNGGHLSAFGLSPDSLETGIGAWMDRIDPADRHRVSEAVRSFIEGDGTNWCDEYRVVRADGATATVIDNRYVIRDAEGKPARMFGCIVDVTKQKLADERFQTIVEASPTGIIMTKVDGKIVLVNPEAARLFAYRREELIGRSIDILVPPRLRSGHTLHGDGFTRHPEARRMGNGSDLFGLRKDGTEFPVEISLNPIQTSEGSHVLNLIVDISDRLRTEHLKDEFVATVSHELRTPLTSIGGALGLLVGNVDGNLPSSAMRLLTIAYANSQRLARLVDGILTSEKIQSGKVAFVLKRVVAQSLVKRTIEANQAFADTRGVRMSLDSSSTAGEIRADPDWIVQVVTNLLSNAIKFSPRGEEIVVAIEKRGGTVRISVRDHGHGIPDDFKPHIFERFAQANTTDARIQGGSGLGLSIVKEIVTRLGGQVDFDDAPGGGTIFYVELPGWEQEIEIVPQKFDAKPKCAGVFGDNEPDVFQ